jgi:hypothetical protein
MVLSLKFSGPGHFRPGKVRAFQGSGLVILAYLKRGPKRGTIVSRIDAKVLLVSIVLSLFRVAGCVLLMPQSLATSSLRNDFTR